MKRVFYIFCFTVLGLLLQLIVHSIVESGVIALLIEDFDRYGLGLSWDQWYAIHHVAGALLFLAGGILGFRGGVHWWRVIYVEKRYPWKFKKPAA
jgi:hypothetical protein